MKVFKNEVNRDIQVPINTENLYPDEELLPLHSVATRITPNSSITNKYFNTCENLDSPNQTFNQNKFVETK